MLRPAAAILLIGLLAGCSQFGEEAVLDISSNGAAFSIQNVSDRTVSYFAIEVGEAARMDLGNPSGWPTFRPGEGYHGPPIGFVVGFDEGDIEFLVYWSTGSGINRERVHL